MTNIDFLKLYFDDGAADDSTAGADDNKGTDNGSDDSNKLKYTDADLDRIIDRKFAKWKKQQAAAVDEATRLANMTAQEKAEHERDELQKKLDALERANTIAEMEKTARGILQADGVTVPDEIVSTLVGEDADETSSNVKAFAKAFKKAVQDEVKRQLTHKSPSSGTGSGTLTKADIMKEKDPIKRQKLIRENMSLFNK